MRSGGSGAFEVDMPGFALIGSSDEDNDSENNSPPLSSRGTSVFIWIGTVLSVVQKNSYSLYSNKTNLIYFSEIEDKPIQLHFGFLSLYNNFQIYQLFIINTILLSLNYVI